MGPNSEPLLLKLTNKHDVEICYIRDAWTTLLCKRPSAQVYFIRVGDSPIGTPSIDASEVAPCCSGWCHKSIIFSLNAGYYKVWEPKQDVTEWSRKYKGKALIIHIMNVWVFLIKGFRMLRCEGFKYPIGVGLFVSKYSQP